MTRPILNVSDVEFRDWGHGAGAPGAQNPPEQFQARLGTIGRRLGAQKLDYNVTVIPPGKRAFPFHNHRVNEEMFFILAGEGEVRIGSARHPIKTGDVIACPPGGPDTAHQIINTSQGELRFLAISTRLSPELVDYPDSAKFGMLAELPPGADGKPQMFRFVGRAKEGE
jgi:uncharacterized cupin superfamily protein